MSKEKIVITKIIKPTDEENTPLYLAKVPYEVGDEFGNKATLYRTEYLRKEDLERQKKDLEAQIENINEMLKAIK